MKINKKLNLVFLSLFVLISGCGGSNQSTQSTSNNNENNSGSNGTDVDLIPRQEIIINGNDSSVSYKGRNLINAVSAGSDKEDDLTFEIFFPDNNNDGVIEIIDSKSGTFKINAPMSKSGNSINFDLKITNNDRIDEKTNLPEVDIRYLKVIIKDDQNSGNFSYNLHKNSAVVDVNLDGYKYYTSSDARNYILPINYRVHLSRPDIDAACENVLKNGVFEISNNEDNSYVCFYFKPSSDEVDVFNREFAGEVVSLYFFKEKIENTVVYYDEEKNKIFYKSLLEDWYEIPDYYKQTEPSVNNKSLFEKSGEISVKEKYYDQSQKLNTVFTNKGVVINENSIYLVNTISEELEEVKLEKENNSVLEWIPQKNTSNSFVIIEKGTKNRIWEIKRNLSSDVVIDDVGVIVSDNIIKIKNDIVSMTNKNGFNYISINGNSISEHSFFNNNGFINDNFSELYIPIIKNNSEKIFKVKNGALEDIGIEINSIKNEVYSAINGLPYKIHSKNMSYKDINYNNGGYHIKDDVIYLSLHETDNTNHQEIYNLNELNNISKFINDKIDSGSSSISDMVFKVKDLSYGDNVVFSYSDGNKNNVSFLENDIANKDISKIIKIKGNKINLMTNEGNDFYQICSSENGFVESNNNIDQYIEGKIKDVSMIDEKIYLIDNNTLKIFDISITNCN